MPLLAPILPYAGAHDAGKIEVARRGEIRRVRARRVKPPIRDRVEHRDAQRLVGNGGADAFDRDAPVAADANGRQGPAPDGPGDLALRAAEDERRLPPTKVAAPTGAT